MNGVSEEVPVLRLHCACGTGSLTRIGHGLTSVTPRRPTTSSSVDLFSIGSHTERGTAGRTSEPNRLTGTHAHALGGRYTAERVAGTESRESAELAT